MQDFRQCQAAFKAFWNAGGNILSASDCADAADQLQGPERGKINRVVTFTRGLGPKSIIKFTDGRHYRWHHQYDETGTYIGTTVHRYAGIGSKGKFYSRAHIDAAWPTIGQLADTIVSIRAPDKKALQQVVPSRKRLVGERQDEALRLSAKKAKIAEKKEKEAIISFQKESESYQFCCEVGGCTFMCLTANGLRNHVVSCYGRSTRMDKELAAESMAPTAVVRSMMDLEGTAVVDRDWSGGRQHCWWVRGGYKSGCTCSAHWEFPLGWATHEQNRTHQGNHSTESVAFLEKLFSADSRTESGEAESLMKVHFHGGVGRDYQHRKTRKQCKSWFSTRSKKPKPSDEGKLQQQELKLMAKEDKLSSAVEKKAKADEKALERRRQEREGSREGAQGCREGSREGAQGREGTEKERKEAEKAAEKERKEAEKAAREGAQGGREAAAAQGGREAAAGKSRRESSSKGSSEDPTRGREGGTQGGRGGKRGGAGYSSHEHQQVGQGTEGSQLFINDLIGTASQGTLTCLQTRSPTYRQIDLHLLTNTLGPFQTHRQIHKPTDSQTIPQTHRQSTDSQTIPQTHRQSHRPTDNPTDSQTTPQTHRQPHKLTDKPTDRIRLRDQPHTTTYDHIQHSSTCMQMSALV